MNRAKCDEYDYIQFLVATPKNDSCVEAARVTPEVKHPLTHDAFTRLLQRLEPDPEALWAEVGPQLERGRGILVIDDTTLDKPYAQKMALVSRHWSGKHHEVVQGINLVTLLWTDGDGYLPCDYRVYAKAEDNLTKNEHFRTLLTTARARGFSPSAVVFDSWYGSLDNLKLIRSFGWIWLTQLKSNRLINVDRTGNQAVSVAPLSAQGQVVHLKGYGMVRVFRKVTPDGHAEYWATNDLAMSDLTRQSLAEHRWMIEVYHRDLKQHTGAERCQARSARAQRNHIGCAIRAFVRLERFLFRTGISPFEAKARIIREAVRTYLVAPLYTLTPSTA